MHPPLSLRTLPLPDATGAAYGAERGRVDLVVWPGGRARATWELLTLGRPLLVELVATDLLACDCEDLAAIGLPADAGVEAQRRAARRARWAAAALRDERRSVPDALFLAHFFADRAADCPLAVGAPVEGDAWESLPVGTVVDVADGSAQPLVCRGGDGFRWIARIQGLGLGYGCAWPYESLRLHGNAKLTAVLRRVPRGSAELLVGLARQGYAPAAQVLRSEDPPACRVRRGCAM